MLEQAFHHELPERCTRVFNEATEGIIPTIPLNAHIVHLASVASHVAVLTAFVLERNDYDVPSNLRRPLFEQNTKGLRQLWMIVRLHLILWDECHHYKSRTEP